MKKFGLFLAALFCFGLTLGCDKPAEVKKTEPAKTDAKAPAAPTTPAPAGEKK